jgi:large subunit ribosomal protein L31
LALPLHRSVGFSPLKRLLHGVEGVGLAVARLAGYNAALFTPLILQSHDMKENIHPKYQHVVFQDLSSDFAFLTRSTMSSKETVKWEDGNEYPVVKLDISSHSHPFYTGKQKTLDVGGRVDKFRQRYGQK